MKPGMRHTNKYSQVEKKWLRQAFSKAAPNYNGIAHLQRKIGRDLLHHLSSNSQAQLTIVDVGCGTGFCINEMVNRESNAEYIGLDISEGMLQQAKQKLGANALYICGDAEALPLVDNSADLIVSNLTLQWCHNLDDVFAGFQRVLKPGGLLLFTTFGSRTLGELREAWRQVDKYNHVNHFYKPVYLMQSMENAGLIDTVTSSQLHKIRYTSVLDLMRELKGIGAHNVTAGRYRGLTGKGRLKRMITAYEAKLNSNEIWASYEVLLGKARKCYNQQWATESIQRAV